MKIWNESNKIVLDRHWIRHGFLSDGIILSLSMKGGGNLHFTSYLQDGCLTVALTGEIDHQCAKNYIDAITSKIEVYNPGECVLDFEQVSFMDSSGIAVIINALRQMTRIGGKLFVSGLGSQPMRVFRASGVDKLVDVKEVVS